MPTNRGHKYFQKSPKLYSAVHSSSDVGSSGRELEGEELDESVKRIYFYNNNKNHFVNLGNVRPISYKDQQRFTSPWAVEMADEETFDKTMMLIGRLLGQDYILLMVTPAVHLSPDNQVYFNCLHNLEFIILIT